MKQDYREKGERRGERGRARRGEGKGKKESLGTTSGSH